MIQATPIAVPAPALRFDTSDTGLPRRGRDLTLLDVIEAIHESTDDLAEAAAVLAALLRSGSVRWREPRG